ncbi:Rho termination factor N-terminal domain-containing protein [uncultured Microbacterium sp.]|uniref:Rho termination factor N-terminal domain-containing protein n=1 Tax=uncultured Microbacterium sp. TaxID=191216 RepID=UPI0025D5A96D|nr:Rho termination factor N-terminal domain-containing protein [uncultured Microbacterium sp.]
MRIIHPQAVAGRQEAFDVEFTDGVATVEALHPERELALRQHGFRFEEDPEVVAPYHGGLGEPIVDLTAMTIAQLREIAEMDGIELPSKAKHAEIVEILSAATPNTDVPEFATVELPDGAVLGDGTSIVTLSATED